MDARIGTDRTAIEARARRLAAALVVEHEELDGLERRRERASADGAQRRALRERAEDLASITTLLSRTHPLRMAAEHVASVVTDWEAAPPSTDEGRAGSLSMVIAMSMLRREIQDRRLAA